MVLQIKFEKSLDSDLDMGTEYVGMGTRRTAGGATRDHEQGSCTDFVRIWVRLQSTRQFLYGLWNRSETDFGLLSYGKETASRSILAVFVRKKGTGSISIMDGPRTTLRLEDVDGLKVIS